jgi:hypothetical protein
MSEMPDKIFEQKVEHIPTPEEVLGVLGRMVRGEYTETNRLFDKSGNLYRLDATTPEKDGWITEFIYLRKGVHANGDKSRMTEINSVSIKGDSYGTGSQASLIDGQWVIID